MTGVIPSTRGEKAVSVALGWLIAISIAGYPLVGMTATVLGVESTLVTIPYRVAVLILSVLISFAALLTTARPAASIWLILFIMGYLVRIYYDNFVDYLMGAEYAWIIFVGNTLPTVLAAMLAGDAFSSRRTIWPLFAVAFASSLGLVLFGLFSLAFEGVSSLEQTGNRLNLETVNAITIGQIGATLTLIGAVIFAQERSTRRRVLAVIGAILGLWAVSQSGSRGPFIALLFCGTAYLMVRFKVRGVIAIVVLSLILVTQLNVLEITAIERLTTALQDESGLTRLHIQQNALAQFVASPIFGSAFAELTSLQYPHNIFIETLMAMGLLGFAALIMTLIAAGRSVVAGFRHDMAVIPLLFCLYFTAAQFSGAIWGAGPLLTLLAILTGGFRREIMDATQHVTNAPPIGSARQPTPFDRHLAA